jgi:hypothetical protein
VQRGGSQVIRNPTPEEQGAALADAYLGLLREAELLVRARPEASRLSSDLNVLVDRYRRLFQSLETRKAKLTESDQARVDDSVGLRFKNANPPWDDAWLTSAVAFYQVRDSALAGSLDGLRAYVR